MKIKYKIKKVTVYIYKWYRWYAWYPIWFKEHGFRYIVWFDYVMRKRIYFDGDIWWNYRTPHHHDGIYKK